jgi:hypothetical protein
MTRTFALKGGVSGELISWQGRVLVHDNPRELQYLFPKMEVVEIPVNPDGRPTMWVGDHPELATVQWPLDPKDFNLKS